MTTRAKADIFKPKHIAHVTKHLLPSFLKPTIVKQALHVPHWHSAMLDELIALRKNNP